MPMGDFTLCQHDPVSSFYLPVLQEMKQAGKFCDVTFKVENRLLSAHRNIIAAAFPYFRTVFRTDVPKEEIDTASALKDLDAETMETFINFAYGKQVVVNEENVYSLLLGADLLQVKEIHELCSGHLGDTLCISNVFRIRTFSECLKYSSLTSVCDRYIRNNFKECSQCEDFLSLSLPVFKELISSDYLISESEERVFEAVMQWVKKSHLERQEYLPELLKNVRMTLLSPVYLAEKVGTEELVQESLVCRQLLEEARAYHILPEKRSTFCTFRTLPRSCKKGHCATPDSEAAERLYVFSTGRNAFVESYDFEKTAWIRLPFDINCAYLFPRKETDNMQTATDTALYSYRSGDFTHIDHVISAKARIYVFRDNCLETLDLKAKTWDFSAIMERSSKASGVVFHHDKIYFCGGRTKAEANSIQFFDSINNIFTTETHLTDGLLNPGVVSLGDHIYLMGGTLQLPHPSDSTDAVVRYNPCRRTWSRLSSMLTSRSCPLSTAMDGKIYVSGGFQIHSGRSTRFPDTVEVYTPSSMQWYNISPMFSTGKIISSVSCSGKLYIFQTSNRGRTVDIYDPKTGQFECDETKTSEITGVLALAVSLE